MIYSLNTPRSRQASTPQSSCNRRGQFSSSLRFSIGILQHISETAFKESAALSHVCPCCMPCKLFEWPRFEGNKLWNSGFYFSFWQLLSNKVEEAQGQRHTCKSGLCLQRHDYLCTIQTVYTIQMFLNQYLYI